LPNGGGYQICGLYDVTRSAFGQGAAGTVVSKASKFGERREVFDGIDIAINGRLVRGATFSGGVSTGKTLTDNCLVVDSPQSLYCKTTNPWVGQTQIKLSGVFPLPWRLQGSGVFQNLPGIPITATRTFSNAEILPSLGRNLASCPAATGACTASSGSIALIEPFTQRENRLTQLDIRLARNIQLSKGKFRAMFDIYNAFNANSILVRNNTFGSTWGRPSSILAGRIVKLGGEFTF